jgi:hypothetical protein
MVERFHNGEQRRKKMGSKGLWQLGFGVLGA